MIKTLPKQTGKMYFALDSSIENMIQHFSLSSNIMPLRYLYVL